MVDRPTEKDIALDGIDDAFKLACGQVFRDLETYAPGAGIGPKTFEEAKELARKVLIEARAKRSAAIEIVVNEIKA
jgi:hypothetical protein